ncbi:type II toxin-antitoxin system HicA family toxin [Alicyclobacillus dauci]|uniref:Type II toxin-antitoxin system HicA family toxin n=1 Tax=Alicyclobacillus dauci TaxID=1475485 RepID=A0ABY6Z8T0_9BACL|nr:type II toxin-antitoxin system HicA family toxin [Alicyclobacillus dauci]
MENVCCRPRSRSNRSYSSREVLAILRADGWVIKHQVGSHIQLVHPNKPGKTTVPHPERDLDPKTVRSIGKQTGITFK